MKVSWCFTPNQSVRLYQGGFYEEKKWYKSVIFLIRHVLDPNRTSLCFDEFKRKFPEEEIFSKTKFLMLKLLSEPLRVSEGQDDFVITWL